MRIRWALVWGLMLGLGSVQAQKPAQPQTNQASNTSLRVGKSSDALVTYLSAIEDLQGDFRQIVQSKRGETVSMGKMFLQRDGKFRWEYQGKNEQVIVSDGVKVFHYDKALAQVSVHKRADLVGDVAMQILGGQADIERKFLISRVTATTAPKVLGQYGGDLFRLMPREKTEQFDGLWVSLKQGELAALLIESSTGDSLFLFDGVRRNQGINPSVFELVVPDGVDVFGAL